MKTVINVCIGGRSFAVEEDAYQRLTSYLDEFKMKAGMSYQTKELMDDIELRIADLFSDSLSSSRKDVVDMVLVVSVISQLGMPDGTDSSETWKSNPSSFKPKPVRKFYRDPDEKKIGGVCSGLAAYLDVDIILIRVIFIVALICGSAGFWIYLIFWLISPLAETAAQKCEMRGMEATVENMKQYSTSK